MTGTPRLSTRPRGRKFTPERVRYIAVAKRAQLGSVKRSELAFLAQALPCTGLVNATEAHLLMILINTAAKGAFEAEGQPIVFKSNKQLAFEVNRSESRVSFVLSRLFDAGLVTMQDSGNYKRYSGRPVDGEVTDACGIDLRILIARFHELQERVRTARLEQAATNAALRRYRGSLRMIKAMLEDAAIIGNPCESRIERITTIVGKPASAKSSTLKRAAALLEWIARRLAGVNGAAQNRHEGEKTRCLHAENNKHIHNTNPYQPVDSNYEWRSANAEPHNLFEAGYASKMAYEKSQEETVAKNKQRSSPTTTMVALHDLLQAAPALQGVWGLTVRSWADLVRAIPQMAVIAGISPDARDRAVKQMGEQMAAVAIAVILQKQEMRDVHSGGGYLRAMTERAEVGELHLYRSVHALAKCNGVN